MIVPMTKYSLVIYHRDYHQFLQQLQELGLVDVTIRDVEMSDDQRRMMLETESLRDAVTNLRKLASAKGFKSGGGYGSGEEAFAQYSEAKAKIDTISAELARAHKEVEEARVWGDFSPERIGELETRSVFIQYFMAFNNEFDDYIEDWREEYAIEIVRRTASATYFVVIADSPQPVTINAQSIKAPSIPAKVREIEAEAMEAEIRTLNKAIARAAADVDEIERLERESRARVRLDMAYNSHSQEAEDTLYLLEGYATRESSEDVDKFLDSADAFVIKEKPTPEDDVPVLLRNNWFARPFEIIGRFYALPKYGSMDLTPYFAPFYMLFFGFCLCDAGYGLLLLIAGIVLKIKGKGMLKDAGMLTIWCGSATILFGLLTGGFFGISLGGLKAFSGFKDYFLNPNQLFTLSIAVGFVQVLFGLILKAITLSSQFGLKYALSTIGWMIVIVSSLAAVLLPTVEVEAFTVHSTAYYVLIGIGLGMMLLLNNPAKNPLKNIGPGLWETYNYLSGLLGDILSYIRLFAIGLSGGILALVFNDLAVGMSPDIPGVRQIVMLIIIVVGHSINLFMSALGSFVHPMRLTFVEFYKNAGFEAAQRKFDPLRK